jgi:bacterioferritin
MCENWNYKQLEEMIQKRAIAERIHAEKLIARILFLERKQIVSKLNKIIIDAELLNIRYHDYITEVLAINSYTDSINVAAEVVDNNTKVLLESIP